jgi:tetratricopeptide (TPR) repeat protein
MQKGILAASTGADQLAGRHAAGCYNQPPSRSMPCMRNSDNVKDTTKLAEQLIIAGDLDRAEQLVREVLAELPEDARALHLAGLLEHRRGRHAEALPLLLRAIELDPQDITAYNSCGEAYRGLGELQAAEACFRRALQLAPGQFELHLNLGLTLWALGRKAQAETYFKNVLTLRPDSPKANYFLGRLELEDEKFSAAEQRLRRALALQPDYAEASLLLGRSLASQGRTPEAAASFERALCAQPNMAAAHYEAARVAFELADEPRAIERLSTAIALDPALSRVPGARAATGKNRQIEVWCREKGKEFSCVAKPQWHKVAPAKLLPREAGSEILDPPQPFSTDIFVAEVDAALVLPGELLAMAPGGSIFIDGLASQAYKRLYTSRFVVHAADDGRLLLVLPEKTLDIDAPCVLLGAAASYFEWIFECLARLWAVRQRPSLDSCPLVVQSGLTHWQKETLEMLGYGRERLIEVPEDAALRCKELHLASLVSVGHFIAPVAI